MKASDVAAWWGAGIATIVLFWDILKWSLDGPRLRIQISTNMIEVGNGSIGKIKHIYVKVFNLGNAPTTIESFCGFSPEKGKTRFHTKTATHFLVPNPKMGRGLNYVLKPGEYWSGSVEQETLERDFNGRDLYLGVFHAFKPNKLKYKKVVFRKSEPEAERT
jgi:hypothetical protein